MNSVEKAQYEEIYKEVADEVNLSPDVVKGIYEGYWLFAKEYIKGLNLKSDTLTEEEFIKLNASVNFPSLGKLMYPINRFRAIKSRNVYIKSLNNNDN